MVRRTVELLQKNLDYGGKVHYFVGCDGQDDTPAQLKDFKDVTVLAEPSWSLGANLNRLIRATNDEYLYAQDDDHWLLNTICPCNEVYRLQSDKSAGWVHLMLDAVGDEENDGYKFTATLDGRYWRIGYTPENDWPCSFRPHLWRRDFTDCAGPFDEGLPTGRTEWQFNQRVKRLGMAGQLPSVLVPLCAYGFGYWAHVGASWNKRGL